ncbi:STY4526/YPO1902 family pathogenicity island replication protein [Aliamphritea hakodatensis]|uniref:STY4526/YPO1902 family pathogenicity island replication protein n=1 Tax=Aliamphritea hakodatensis TaxID=2895352 RepID=UPI0022FD4E18|nr:STY4526/YPO1902 family pathogenicity island replication protein [Aliamphritea hakodatensis]
MSRTHKHLCQAAAQSLLIEIERSYTAPDELTSLSNNEQFFLSSLTLGQQRFLVEKAEQYIFIQLDIDSLRQKIEEVRELEELRRLEDNYLLLGAPLCLMRRLFGLHAAEFSHRRKLLNIGGTSNGRPRQCDESTEHIIWAKWNTLSGIDERHKFLQVAEETGVDLHQIWAALKEHLR